MLRSNLFPFEVIAMDAVLPVAKAPPKVLDMFRGVEVSTLVPLMAPKSTCGGSVISMVALLISAFRGVKRIN